MGTEMATDDGSRLPACRAETSCQADADQAVLEAGATAGSPWSRRADRAGIAHTTNRLAMKWVTAYTDGACRGNPGPGGWGAVLEAGSQKKELCGGELDTTNNRMELTAAIRALEALKESCRIDLYTDSTYVRDGITKWLPDWRRRGWKTAARKPVKNKDLWERLAELTDGHSVEWHWVRGHSGHPGNERADALANAGIDRLLGRH
jgi:ribonuclease HI